MAFRGIAEFVLQIEHFRNIDLFQQGLYYLRFQIFNEDILKVTFIIQQLQIYYANPYDYVSKDKETRNKQKASFHRLQEPAIQDETASFVTKIFFIRYAEEPVTVRDVVKFRTEIDIAPGYFDTEFYLRCDLYYATPPISNFTAVIGSAEIMREEIMKQNIVFTCVQTKIFQINNLLNGFSSLVPITFEKEFTSLCICTLHGSLIDFRFRVQNARLLQQEESGGDLFMENGILVEKKYVDEDFNQFQKNKIEKWVPKNVAEYFFFDEFGFLNISDAKIFQCYGEFTETLRQVYENLKVIYIKMSNKCLLEEDLNTIDFPRVPPELELKGLEYFLDSELKDRLLSPNVKIEKSKQLESQLEEMSLNTELEQSSAAQKQSDQSERLDFESPSMEPIADEEEKKVTPFIPVSKTNMKSDRFQSDPKKNNHNLQEKKKSDFTFQNDKYQDKDPQKIANAIVMEINNLAGQLFELSNNLAKLIIFKPKKIYKNLLDDYQKRLEEKYGENILRHVIQTSDFSFPSEDYTGQLNDVVAKKTREVLALHKEMAGVEKLPVEEVKIDEIAADGKRKKRKKRNMEKYAPLIFEECYIKNKNLMKVANSFELQEEQKIQPNKITTGYKGVHLFVMAHGFQGSSFDMRMFKNIISVGLPEAQFLCAASNEDDTEGNIFDMGYRLAQEVHQYIRESCPGNNLGRITFIGHSLGGLIIRAALPYLEKFKDKMHGYLTLCSPHLGYMYKSGKLFNAGMWVMKKWRKSQCLSQLSMTDHKELEKSALFELSKSEGLAWFKQIILVSSFQDQYAPFDSARIQICSDAAKDITKGNTYIQMVNNLLANVPLDVLYRLDVNFQIQETSLDSWIGRTAHILFLENEELMKMIVSRYKEFFS